MDEEEKGTPTEALSRTVGVVSGHMTRKRRDDLYLGRPPKNAYFGTNKKGLEHIHDLSMSEETKKRLYGLGKTGKAVVNDVVESRLGTDSRSDLIRELADNTSLTRVQAEEIVDKWMRHNDLMEKDDPVLGKIIVPRQGG